MIAVLTTLGDRGTYRVPGGLATILAAIQAGEWVETEGGTRINPAHVVAVWKTT